jgi:dTMP kinase
VTRGLLVVFEGAEGVGKTTQVARLAAAVRTLGIPIDTFREPGGTALGDEIRRLLLEPAAHDVTPRAEALLFMAARAQLAERIRHRLGSGAVVLLDRFFLSTYAYQIAGRGLPEALVREANRLAVGDLVPDLTLLLVCEGDEAQRRMTARGGLDRIERESLAFHERVAAGFREAATAEWLVSHAEVGPVDRVDAGGTVEAVGRRIEAALKSRWPETFSLLGESH